MGSSFRTKGTSFSSPQVETVARFGQCELRVKLELINSTEVEK